MAKNGGRKSGSGASKQFDVKLGEYVEVKERTIDKLSEKDFFFHVDKVLDRNKRQPLKPDSAQRRIIRVNEKDRVLQILAGPGSGKTEMLVWRVLYELLVRGAESNRLMVTTFTNKAAAELEIRLVERCDQFLESAHHAGLRVSDPHVHDLRIGTIHSLCDQLLAEFDSEYMEAGTQVIDEMEATMRLMKDWNFALRSAPSNKNGTDERVPKIVELTALFRPPWQEDKDWPVSRLERVDFMSMLLAQQTETWQPRCASTGKLNGVEVIHNKTGLTMDVEKLRTRWEEYLRRNHILDFATIQKKLLERQHAILPYLDHIFVDEFQDTNPIQFSIHTGWLAADHTRLTVVGDDDQALYRFRGSDIACFNNLEPHCRTGRVPFRREILDENHRSNRTIVDFARSFREQSSLARISMEKVIVAPTTARPGDSVRLLTGPWQELCNVVAHELYEAGAGRVPIAGQPPPPSAAVLMFSTSERGVKNPKPAATLKGALLKRGLRAFNPRNKTASDSGSPVAELMGLVSYFFDPIKKAPVGKNGRSVEIWASCNDDHKARAAIVTPPKFPVHEGHAQYQKLFVKADEGDIGAPALNRAPLLRYLDALRTEIITAAEAAARETDVKEQLKKAPVLTISGLIARLLSFDYFRRSGFTVELFRQALFTNLLESAIAPTRLSKQSLDQPITGRREGGKIVWDDRYWNFLSLFGSILRMSALDDEEVDVFADNAVTLMTFHQAKGLEFDHVYVAATGRTPSPHSVLKTMLFSGETVPYKLSGGQPETADRKVLELSTADRDREVYVALTRAKQNLTILFDPGDDRPNMDLHAVLKEMFSKRKSRKHPASNAVNVQEWSNA